MNRILAILANAFPLWVAGTALIALFHPEWFTWFAQKKIAGQSFIVWGLGIIMLGMGLTLTVEDFKNVLHLPKAVGLGILAQYTIMPLTGWSVAHAMGLPTAFAVGLILTACCPGGTASNIVTYMARGNVALSVLMTTGSTMIAVFMTPLLTKLLAGKLVPVDVLGLVWDTFKVVVIPVVLGVTLNSCSPALVRRIGPWSPLAAGLTVAMICASIVAVSAQAIRENLGLLTMAVFLLHSIGFGLGYLVTRLAGYDRIVSRTISIEVGMQNSGLAVFLARQHFSADPLTAVPGAISSVFHSVIGSMLAGWWRLKKDAKIAAPA